MHLNGSNESLSESNYLISKNGDDSQEVDLIKYFNLILLNKWYILLFVALGAIISLTYAYLQTPIYNGTGTLIISQSQNRYSYAGSDLSSLLTTTYGIGVGSTIANELQVLKSTQQSFKLAERLLEMETDQYGKKFPILWRNYPNDSTSTSVDTIAARYRGTILFSRIDPLADIVQIDFESPSPTEAATVVNLTMDSYDKLSTEQNRVTAISALSFLRQERDRIEKDLNDAEDSLKAFMNSTNLVSVNPQAEDLIDKISTIESRRQTIQVSLVAVNSSINAYSSQLDKIKPGLSEQYSNALAPIIERAQFKLAELETEKLMYQVKNPNILDSNTYISNIDREIDFIKERINNLTKELFESESDLYLSFISNREGRVTQRLSEISEKLLELRIQKTELETQQQVLDRYYSEIDEDFENLPNGIIQLSRLQRNVEINEQLFLLVANQFAEMSLWEKTQFGMGRPLDYALAPKNPVRPKKKIILALGIILGGFIGLGFVFIRVLLNDKILSTDDLKPYRKPILGTIPDFSILDGLNADDRQFIDDKSVSNQLITFLDHISPISEAYRRLRINVVYANPDKAYKVIMVTSAAKGEGKSTVAANLAVTFSEAEKSVLIIDLDLRRPTQHKIFGENREPGLTDSLFETIRIGDITNTTIAPNVDLITVGKKTPEPATVLDSKRLKQLIDKLGERYDHVILDTAPYGIISDSASLLRLVDGIVVVSRFDVTTKRELSFTLEGLQHLNADVLGIVLNAFDPKKSTDYYTNYSYYKRTYSEYYQEK